jgi:hypothetical protein
MHHLRRLGFFLSFLKGDSQVPTDLQQPQVTGCTQSGELFDINVKAAM